MNIDWSFHAQDQLAGILRTIAFKLSYDDAVRWRLKINDNLAPLADFPDSCPNIPPECFYEIPPLVNRLRQSIFTPYRIVYEPVGDQIRVLAILHSHQLITEPDTLWDK